MAQDATQTKLDLKPHQIILRPLVTEKGFHKAERYNSYAFEVNRMAGKQDIRRAVEELFDVHVTKVWTAVFPGKRVRLGVHYGVRPVWKRATVKLRPGDRIDLFEEV